MILPIVTIAPSKKGGRGVFATEIIDTDTVVENSPVLLLSKKDRLIAEQTYLYNYFFEWGEPDGIVALGLGYISLYNHDADANCKYDMDYENERIIITALRKIEPGEELCINYHGEAKNNAPLWFETI